MFMKPNPHQGRWNQCRVGGAGGADSSPVFQRLPYQFLRVAKQYDWNVKFTSPVFRVSAGSVHQRRLVFKPKNERGFKLPNWPAPDTLDSSMITVVAFYSEAGEIQ